MTPFETPETQHLDPNCIFCKIVSGELPSRRIYEDERAVAFLDIAAWHRGHSLVVPKRHVPDIITGSGSLSEIAAAVDAVARLLKHRLAADGINLLSVRWRRGRSGSLPHCICTSCRVTPTSPVCAY